MHRRLAESAPAGLDTVKTRRRQARRRSGNLQSLEKVGFRRGPDKNRMRKFMLAVIFAKRFEVDVKFTAGTVEFCRSLVCHLSVQVYTGSDKRRYNCKAAEGGCRHALNCSMVPK